MKNTTQQPLSWKWTRPIDKDGETVRHVLKKTRGCHGCLNGVV